MRRFDKKKNIQKANILAEQRYLESKGLIKEGMEENSAHMVINNVAKKIYSLVGNKGFTPSLDIEGKGTVLGGEDGPNKFGIEVVYYGEDRNNGGEIRIFISGDKEKDMEPIMKSLFGYFKDDVEKENLKLRLSGHILSFLEMKEGVNEIGPETAAKGVSFGNDPRQERVLKDATNSLFGKYLNNSDANFLFITGDGQNTPSKYVLTDVITNVRAKTVLFKFYNEGGDEDGMSYSSDKMNINVKYSIDKDEFENQGRYGGGNTNQFTANFFVSAANTIRKIYYKLEPPTIDYKDEYGEPKSRPDTDFDIKSRRKKQDFDMFEGEGQIDEVADNDSSMIISKIAKNIYSIAKNKGFNPSLSYDKGHGGMSGQISKGDNSKDEKGNEKPSLGILPLMNDNTIKLEVTSGIGWDKLGDNESRAKMEQTLDFFKNDLFPELFNHYKGLLEKEGINLTSKYEGATGFLIFNK